MWQDEIRESYSSSRDLWQAGLITAAQAERLQPLSDRYGIRLTRYYAGLMTRDENCPIRLQALPDPREEDPALPSWAREQSLRIYGRAAPWTADAIGDVKRLGAPRLTHRYGNRAILHVASMCAVYCRFCFRKSHLNEKEDALYGGPLEPAFAYLRAHSEIRELILTGGDPLSLADEPLARVLDLAAGVPHLRSVRLHSRMAVTLPSRLTTDLAGTLAAPRPYRIALASHFNHPRELTREARAGLDRLARAGILLLNQSVLLAGVNDEVATLETLFQDLYEAGVRPFYLHHPDWTPGTFPFRLSIERGRRLVRELRGRVSGPAMPEYVLDIPQGYGKIPVLDESSLRLVEAHAPDDPSRIGGAVYEATAPELASGAGSRRPYLDLFRER